MDFNDSMRYIHNITTPSPTTLPSPPTPNKTASYFQDHALAFAALLISVLTLASAGILLFWLIKKHSSANVTHGKTCCQSLCNFFTRRNGAPDQDAHDGPVITTTRPETSAETEALLLKNPESRPGYSPCQ